MQGQDLREVLYRKFGSDLTAIEGIGVTTGLVILTEVGPDVHNFKTEKHFCSWLAWIFA
jgi:transposase